MTQALFYSSNAVAMTLAAGIGSGDVSCTLSTATGLPASFPFKLLIGWSTGQQEVVHCTALAGAVATIVRGQDGTTAQAHSIGASVVHGVSAREFNDLELHVGSTGAVHGLAGNIVGTTDTQTLSGKTLTAPIISTISNTGTLTLPTSTDTLVGRATTDTLTNKTLTGATLDVTSTLGGVSGTVLSGAWTPYSATFTNFTQGNAAVITRYKQVGKTVTFAVTVVPGSTSSYGGIVSVSLPVAAATGYAQNVLAVFWNGTSNDTGIAQLLASATTASLFCHLTTGSSALGNFQGTSLGTVVNSAVSGNWNVYGTYEAA